MSRIFLTMIVFFTFIAKVTAQIEVHSSNQVGIGTTNPQYKLHVVGDAYVSGNFYLGNAANFLQTNFPNLVTFNNTTSGSSNVSYGFEALLNPGGSENNTAVGYRALRNTTGNNNTAFGSYALYSNTTGRWNNANGSYALYSNTTGECNTATGSYALYYNTTGRYNNANGYNALYANSTGTGNTATGYSALYSNTMGDGNTADGSGALYSNSTGSENTAIGCSALQSNTTGNYNTATGYCALFSNYTGEGNTVHGYRAGVGGGNYNTASGYFSHMGTSGDYNTAYGANPFFNFAYGNYNTTIGCNAQFQSATNNATAIGYASHVTASNQVRLGNSSVTSIGGYVAWSNLSDGRAKRNIRANVPGLAFVKNLQPVTYNLDLDAIDNLIKREEIEIKDEDGNRIMPQKSQELIDIERKSREKKQSLIQTGFVAQDVEKSAKSIGYEFSGVDVDEMGIYSLRYAEFVVPLVKAVQELSEQNDKLQEQVEALMKRLEKLESK